MKKLKLGVFTLILIFSLLISGCSTGGGDKKSTTKNGGTLIIGIESEADTLDPHSAGGWVTMRIDNQIYEPLVGEDLSKSSKQSPVPKLVPILASSYSKSSDGKTYTFNLRKNVKFQDGTSFNAESVAFNLRRLTDPGFKYYYKVGAARTFRTFLFYKGYKIINDYKIEINLKKPFADFPRMLGEINSLQIISPAAIKKYGNNQLGNHPVGTGPFKFQSRERGQKIVLVKNKNYWGKKAYLDKVIFKPISNASSRVLALQNNSVDMIAVPPPDALAKLKQQKFKIVSGTPPHVWYLNFNMDNSIMKNKKVRQAINYAIDRQAIANNLLKGTVKPAYTIQSPANLGYDPSRKWYKYNPAKAKELLKEAGYTKGFSTTLRTSVDGSGQLLPTEIAQWIQRDLKKVGINLKIETSEWISYLANFPEGMPKTVGMNQMSSGRTTPYFLSMIANSKFMAPGGYNSGKYNNPKLDKVLNDATTSLNQNDSLKLWKKAETMMMEDAGWAPIVNDSAPYVLSSNVHNFVIPAEEWYSLNNVWVSEK